MDKYTITYKSHISKEKAVSGCYALCLSVLDGDTSTRTLHRLCGSIAYNSIYLIPDFCRENNKAYSIENICYFVPGILKLSTHNLLEKCGNINSIRYNYVTELKNILSDCTFAELMSLLELPIKDVYCALFCIYEKLLNNIEIENKIRTMWKSNNYNIHDIWKFFESEVNK